MEYERLVSQFENSLQNAPISDKKKIIDFEIKRVEKIFKKVDKKISENPIFRHWGKNIEIPTFELLYTNKLLSRDLDEPFVRPLKYEDRYYFDYREGISEYVEYMIYLENIEVPPTLYQSTKIVQAETKEVKSDNFKKEESELEQLYSELINNFIDENTSISDFKAVMQNDIPKTKIKWIDKAIKNKDATNKCTLFRFLVEFHPDFEVIEIKNKNNHRLQHRGNNRNSFILDYFDINDKHSLKTSTLNKSISSWLSRHNFLTEREKELINIKNKINPSRQ